MNCNHSCDTHGHHMHASMPKKWQPRRWQGQRLSFLHALRETLIEKLRRSRSFGDLAVLQPRSRSSLEVYVSQVIVCPAVLCERVRGF